MISVKTTAGDILHIQTITTRNIKEQSDFLTLNRVIQVRLHQAETSGCMQDTLRHKKGRIVLAPPMPGLARFLVLVAWVNESESQRLTIALTRQCPLTEPNTGCDF